MRCRAAILHEVGGDWKIEEIQVDPPKAGEVLVHWTHAGLCHSDPLDQINVGYQAMRDGTNIRGVIEHV
jgi:Zn-dependent alcohol dehydrogenase